MRLSINTTFVNNMFLLQNTVYKKKKFYINCVKFLSREDEVLLLVSDKVFSR